MVLGLLSIALCALGCAIDYRVYSYFTNYINDNCVFPANSDQCYCDASRDRFDSYFRHLGPLNCHNPASHNRHILASNAMFSLLSLIVLACSFSNLFVAACSRAAAAAMEYRMIRNSVASP